MNDTETDRKTQYLSSISEIGVHMLEMGRYHINKEALKLYCYYNTERANIYRRKSLENLNPPYTRDPILQSYRFTNVRRELDKQSQFLIRTVCRNDKLSLQDKLFNILLFRLINDGSVIEQTWKGHVLHFPFSSSIPYSDLATLAYIEKRNKTKRHGDAYLTVVPRRLANAHVRDHGHDLSFINTNTGLILYLRSYSHQLEDITELCSSTRTRGLQVYRLLSRIKGLGEFLAYQVYVDLTYCPEVSFGENEFVVSGIGCCLGIDWLTSEDLSPTDKRGQFRKQYGNKYNQFILLFEKELPRLTRENDIPWSPEEFQRGFPDSNWGLMNIENSFCEFAKYMKIYSGSKFRSRKYCEGDNRK